MTVTPYCGQGSSSLRINVGYTACVALALALSPAASGTIPKRPEAVRACAGKNRKPPNADLYVIHAIDPGASTITVQSGIYLTTISARIDTEITINGVKKSIRDLQPNMKAKVTLAEPGIAATIAATGDAPTKFFGNAAPGTPPVANDPSPNLFGSPAPAGVPVANLGQALIGTKWGWGKEPIIFKQDIATHPNFTASWKVTGPMQVTLTIVTPTSRAGQSAEFNFDTELKRASGHNFVGQRTTSSRVE